MFLIRIENTLLSHLSLAYPWVTDSASLGYAIELPWTYTRIIIITIMDVYCMPHRLLSALYL